MIILFDEMLNENEIRVSPVDMTEKSNGLFEKQIENTRIFSKIDLQGEFFINFARVSNSVPLRSLIWLHYFSTVFCIKRQYPNQ